jgi:hypothetical protein
VGIREIFNVPSPDGPESTKPTPEEQELMDKLAKKVVRYGMTVPAILFLETVKPLNYIGSQTMVFFEPFFGALFDLKDYTTFQKGMEKRHNVENLLLTIEKYDAEAQQKERDFKKQQKANRKSWRDRLPFLKKKKS